MKLSVLLLSFSIFFIFASNGVSGAGVTSIPQNPILSRYFIAPKDSALMQKIADRFEVEHRLVDGFHILVPKPEKNSLLALIPTAKLIEEDISREIRRISPEDLKGYHDFTSVQEHLNRIVNTYPELSKLEKYGESMEGRPLLSLRITSPQPKKEKSAVVLTASTHGDELITVEVLFGLLDTLTQSYGKDTRLTKIVDDFEIYFIPVVNPDGYTRQQRYANGIDPNRDYPWPQNPNKSSNPCIKNVMNFFQAHQVKGSIDFHAFGEMIMYPWAYTYEPLNQVLESPLDRITSKMAEFNGYEHGQISKVIYIAKGSSADYYLWKHNTQALAIEIGRTKVPSPSQFPSILKEHLESTWTFIDSLR